MDHGRRSGGRIGAHRGAPYLGRARLPIAALLLLLGAVPAAAGGPAELKSGATREAEVKAPGGTAVFRFVQQAGCRYRLTVTPGTLGRPVLELGRAGEQPVTRVDPGAGGGPAVHVYDAERDAWMEARVGGFSAQTGTAQVRLETLGPGDRPGPAHVRFLAPGGERARVGELLVGEGNEWQLVVEPGKAYEIAPTRGSAGLVRLRVRAADGTVLGDSASGAVAWLAHPPVRFRVPAATAGPAAPPPVLDVRGVFEGGGTYGVRLRELGPDEEVVPPAPEPPAAVERGPVEGQPGAFRAGPGDFALLYVPDSPDRTQVVEMLRGERWVQLEDMGLGDTARSQENALACWFQPYYPGTYRFRGVPGPPPSTPALSLHDRASLGTAPVHMGTGVDPTPRARVGSSWRLVALGVCMPGWDYLFVCVHGPDQGVAMRVRTPDGRTLRTRAAGAQTISPGMGPSLRFRVPGPGVYRLEARSARSLVVQPLLRRAAN